MKILLLILIILLGCIPIVSCVSDSQDANKDSGIQVAKNNTATKDASKVVSIDYGNGIYFMYVEGHTNAYDTFLPYLSKFIADKKLRVIAITRDTSVLYGFIVVTTPQGAN